MEERKHENLKITLVNALKTFRVDNNSINISHINPETFEEFPLITYILVHEKTRRFFRKIEQTGTFELDVCSKNGIELSTIVKELKIHLEQYNFKFIEGRELETPDKIKRYITTFEIRI